MPEEAKQQTKAGAEAFVRYYIEAVNHAQATGDVEPLEELATPGCNSCSALVQRVQEIYGDGGRIRSSGWTVTAAIVLQIDGRTTVDVGLRLPPQTVWESSESSPQRYKGGRSPATFVLKLTPDRGWIVQAVSRGS